MAGEPQPGGHNTGLPRSADDQATERRERVASLLLTGASYRQIAAVVGSNKDTVMRDRRKIVEEWQRRYADNYDGIVLEQVARLARLRQTWWPLALGEVNANGEVITEPDPKAADIVLKAEAQLARIAGTETMNITATVRTEAAPAASDDAWAAEVERLVERLASQSAIETTARDAP